MADRLDSTKLAAARLKAARQYPFLGVALYALSPVPAPGYGTFGVDDRWRLMIDPSALDRWSVDEVAGVMLHEVGHVVRHHSARATAALVDHASRRIWNIAADAEINDDLLADRVVLPDGGITPRRLGLPAGKAAEFYYRHLLANPPDTVLACECGSGAHGLSDGHGLGPTATVSEHVKGLTEAEAELVRRQVALAIRTGRLAGLGSGGWSRWAESFLSPVVDWRRTFAAVLRGSLATVANGRSDYRYHRPSRRRVPRVVLPALVRPVPTIAVVLDTSGSVTDTMLARAWTETVGMLSSVGVRREQLRVWSTDTVAHRIPKMSGQRVELVGGGGTDMVAGIDAALAESPTPDLVVVLTDGETPWPTHRPARPVVVGLMRHEYGLAVHPPEWARVVEIPVDEVADLVDEFL